MRGATIGQALEGAKRGARGLVLPFAVFGLAGGWLVTELAEVSADFRHSVVSAVWLLRWSTMLLCGCAGAFVVRRGALAWGRLLVLVPLAALNGLIFGLNAVEAAESDDAWLLIVFPVVGAMVSFFFFPPLALIAGSFDQRNGLIARRGSIVDWANLRGVWVVTLSMISIASLAAFSMDRAMHDHARASVGIPLACALGLVGLLGGHVDAWIRVRKLAALETRERIDGDLRAGRVDYGVGDAVYEESAPSPLPYRAGTMVIRVHYGSASLAARLLVGRIAWSTFALFFAVFVVMTELPAALLRSPAPASIAEAPAVDPVKRHHVALRGTMLAGIEGHRQRATLVNEEDGTIETIDLASGASIERRSFPEVRVPSNAKGAKDGANGTRAREPLAPTALTRIERFEWYANALGDTGPYWTHVADPGARIVTSRDGNRFAYRDPSLGEQPWRIIGEEEGDARPVPDLNPEDTPLFDPKGETIAWAGRGEAQDPRGGDPEHLYIARVARSGPIQSLAIAGIDHVRSPLWSLAGDEVFVLEASEARGTCLVSVPLHDPKPTRVLLCRPWSFVAFALDESGKHGIFSGRDAAVDALHVLSVALPDGAILREKALPEVDAITLPSGESEAAVIKMRDGLAIVDLTSSCVRSVPGGERAHLPTRGRWTSATHLVTELDQPNGEVTLVTIDRAALGECASPSPHSPGK